MRTTYAYDKWRVASRAVPHSPAHLIVFGRTDRTLCGWEPSARGDILTREQAHQMQCHPCRKCLEMDNAARELAQRDHDAWLRIQAEARVPA